LVFGCLEPQYVNCKYKFKQSFFKINFKK